MDCKNYRIFLSKWRKIEQDLSGEMNEKKAAGIVLYNPEIDRWIQCLNSIEIQCDKIYLVDNASENKSEILEVLKKYKSCTLISNKENKGIATALNQIMEAAEADGFKWVLTLDDDSVCDKNMVEKLWAGTTKSNAGIICPIAVDDKIGNFNYRKIGFEDVYREIENCITAGSLTNVEAWRKCGGFDKKMFIDFVDIEYCACLREHGYKIIQRVDTRVHQQYGNVSKTINFWGIPFSIFNYSPIRIYYSVRNQIYYIHKHKESINKFKQYLFLSGYIGKRVIFEKNRLETIKAIFKGITDGRKM